MIGRKWQVHNFFTACALVNLRILLQYEYNSTLLRERSLVCGLASFSGRVLEQNGREAGVRARPLGPHGLGGRAGHVPGLLCALVVSLLAE